MTATLCAYCGHIDENHHVFGGQCLVWECTCPMFLAPPFGIPPAPAVEEPTPKDIDEHNEYIERILAREDLCEPMSYAAAVEAGCQMENAAATIADLRAALSTLQAQHEVMKEALEFYADEKNYHTTSTGFALQYEPKMPAINVDAGERARLVLIERDQPIDQ